MTNCGLFDSYGQPGSIESAENNLRFEEIKMGTKQGLFNRENCAKKHTVYAITIVLISLLFLNSVAFADLNIDLR